MGNEKPPRRLGRGLEALLRGSSDTVQTEKAAPSDLHLLALTSIHPNPFQPRKQFGPAQLRELEESIKANGLLQPITVRKNPDGNGYQLIAGERRLRAVTRLGWAQVPAIIREVDDQALLSFALIENLQRADLDPVEEAEGYNQLVNEFHLTQQAVAELVGKDRTTIANSLRVLSLPSKVKQLLRDGQLTLGHAKPLLGLSSTESMIALAQEIVTAKLTVREVERRVKARGSKPKGGRPSAKLATERSEVRALEKRVRRFFQTDAKITQTAEGTGTIELTFYSEDDLVRLLGLMGIKED